MQGVGVWRVLIDLLLYPWAMARRKATPKIANIEPAVQTLTFVTPALVPGAATDLYVDLSQVASLVNRRFYRQGLNWAVAGFKLLTPGGFLGDIKISKLPNSWVMANSYTKSLATWTKMNNEALEEADSIRPRFLDFKIYADAAHHAAGYGLNLLPRADDLVTTQALPGEWEASKIYVPIARDTTQAPGLSQLVDLELVATGPSYPGVGASGLNAVSLIEGYAASRGLPLTRDPNAPDDAASTVGTTPENWMTAIFNEGETQSHELIEDMLVENNQAPYPFENDGANLDTMYPGGANQMSGLQVHDIEFITASTIGGTTRLKGGNFPCGLIKLSFTATTEAAFSFLQINLMPGSHRGYLAESMTEM
jgi:hypothetical protein